MITETITVHCDRCLTSVESKADKCAAPDVVRAQINSSGWTHPRAGDGSIVDLCPECSGHKAKKVFGPKHPRWQEFIERLRGYEGCNFREIYGGGSIIWDCRCGDDTTCARTILLLMNLDGFSVPATIQYFALLGARCDCEIAIQLGETKVR